MKPALIEIRFKENLWMEKYLGWLVINSLEENIEHHVEEEEGKPLEQPPSHSV